MWIRAYGPHLLFLPHSPSTGPFRLTLTHLVLIFAFSSFPLYDLYVMIQSVHLSLTSSPSKRERFQVSSDKTEIGVRLSSLSSSLSSLLLQRRGMQAYHHPSLSPSRGYLNRSAQFRPSHHPPPQSRRSPPWSSSPPAHPPRHHQAPSSCPQSAAARPAPRVRARASAPLAAGGSPASGRRGEGRRSGKGSPTQRA